MNRLVKFVLIIALMLPSAVFSRAAERSSCGLACKAVIGYAVYKLVTKEKKEPEKKRSYQEEYAPYTESREGYREDDYDEYDDDEYDDE